MKKIWLIALIGITLGISSCSKDDDKEPTLYSVTFETEGGSPAPATQKIEAGGTVTAPVSNPVKTGYVFLFWHLSGSTTAYNFQTPVTGNITLHAKWQKEAIAEYWQVAWELNGGIWPSNDNHTTQVLKDGTLAEPNAPTKTGNTFEGWYKEAALTNKISFPYDVSNVTTNFALYAKWVAESGGETYAFTIRNTAEWNSAVNAIKSDGDNKSYTLTIEGTVYVPPTLNVRQGVPSTYTFGAGEKLSVTINGNGTLVLYDKGFLMCLSGKSGAKQKLTIDGPTLQGYSDNLLPLLLLEYADLELKAGKITGNTNNGGGGLGDGGGVHINNGRLTMSGGEITNNSCGQNSYMADGGGVAIKNGSFIMSGGTISNNIGQKGGGVYLYGYNFTMTGGTIKGNTARSSSPYGGGVYYRKDKNVVGKLTKTGGIICGSNASEADSNKIVHNGSLVYQDRGAAIFYLCDIVVSEISTKHRETTLGENDDITTDDDAGWGL